LNSLVNTLTKCLTLRNYEKYQSIPNLGDYFSAAQRVYIR
jgi:hypothetical protein